MKSCRNCGNWGKSDLYCDDQGIVLPPGGFVEVDDSRALDCWTPRKADEPGTYTAIALFTLALNVWTWAAIKLAEELL
ncbi:MAG: hypothetical protein WC375_07095 [Methanomassiliicoccales archaeon]|jgi:hypothetical protein